MNIPTLSRSRPSLRTWFTLSLSFLVLAAIIGALLRLIYVVDMPWLYFRPWLHAHSHVAMLGWVFPALLIALIGQDERPAPKGYFRWLTISQIMVAGMLVSFPVQGYGPVSIACSVGQMIAGYALVWRTWGLTRHWPAGGSRLFVRLALVFQLTSTLGVLAMGPIMRSSLAGSEWYYWSIQWFLHFQFNGWFWFAAMAIGSRWGELHGVHVRLDLMTTVMWAVGTVLTFALAIAWSERSTAVLAVNSTGVLIQLLAGVRTLSAMRLARPQALVRTTRWMRVLIGVMLLSMAGKVAAQALVALPSVANMALTLRNYVIGFVHLNTLGTVTVLLFAFAISQGWLNDRERGTRIGLICFTIGICVSEVLLFGQGTALWLGCGMFPGYHWTLFAASALLPIGALLLLVAMRRSVSTSAA